MPANSESCQQPNRDVAEGTFSAVFSQSRLYRGREIGMPSVVCYSVRCFENSGGGHENGLATARSYRV